jgi:hypothetical protein
MRHVKLGPGRDVNDAALVALVEAAYADMGERVRAESPRERRGAAVPFVVSSSRANGKKHE